MSEAPANADTAPSGSTTPSAPAAAGASSTPAATAAPVPASSAATPMAPSSAAPSAAEPAQWYSSLPDDLKTDPNVTKYHTQEELVRGHLSAVSMIGRDKIPLPKTDAEYRDVYLKLGMPDSVEGYKFENTEYNIPQEIYPVENRKADLNEFRSWAHEAGLSNKQAAALYDKFMRRQEADIGMMHAAVSHEMDKCNDAMSRQWGEAKEANLLIANKAMSKMFDEDTRNAIVASGLGRNWGFIKAMHGVGERSLEELGIDKRGNSTRTPDQLQQELAALQAHPAYFDKSNPEYHSVQQRAVALFERLRSK